MVARVVGGFFGGVAPLVEASNAVNPTRGTVGRHEQRLSRKNGVFICMPYISVPRTIMGSYVFGQWF